LAASLDSQACDLLGLGVLVTRAAHQSDPLCRLIEARGGRPLAFPALEIVPTDCPVPALDGYHLAIFVSANAVEHTLARLHARVPPGLQLAAIGGATARVLAGHGLRVSLVPGQGRYDSEGLLALPELEDMSGRRVLILRGEGGRELLAEGLRGRGAQVDYAEVYRRALPTADPGPLIERWARDVQVVLASSVEVLENLTDLLGEPGRDLLTATPLVVVSRRMAERAQGLGCARLIPAAGAADDQVVQALCGWVSERSGA